MFNVSYERLSHVLAIASVAPDDACMEKLQLKQNEVLDQDISFKFSDYVKSQLHYYMNFKLSKKSFFKYTNAYLYLSGDVQHEKDALELLRCFYTDVATFLLHSSVDFNVSLNIDISTDKIWKADVGQIRSDLDEMFLVGEHPDENFKEYLDNSKYSWIFDYVGSIDEGKSHIHNCSLAAALLEMLQDDKNVYKFVEV